MMSELLFNKEDWKDLQIGWIETKKNNRVLNLTSLVWSSSFTRSGHSKCFLSFCRFTCLITHMLLVFYGTSLLAFVTFSIQSGSTYFTLCSVAVPKWMTISRSIRNQWNNMKCRNKDFKNTGKHKRKLIMINNLEMLQPNLKKRLYTKMTTSKRKKNQLSKKKQSKKKI